MCGGGLCYYASRRRCKSGGAEEACWSSQAARGTKRWNSCAACLANPFRKLKSPLDILQMPVSPLRSRSDFAIQDKVHQLLGREIGREHMESITP